MSNKSKNKGSGYERELAKYLGAIYGGHFARVPNSGAMTGGKNFYRKAILSETQNRIYRGDIIPPDHMSKLVLEAKFYAEFRFHQLLQPGAMPQLDEWIDQCMEAIDAGDLWLVCFKINLRGQYVVVPEAFVPSFAFENYAVYRNDHGLFYVTDLRSFFETNREAVLKLSA